MPDRPTTFERREEMLKSRLLYLFGGDDPRVVKLTESKHISTHRDLRRWDKTISKWSSRSQAQKDRDTMASLLAATAAAGGLSRRLTQLLELGEKYLKAAEAAEQRGRTAKGKDAAAAAREQQTHLRRFRATMDAARRELSKTYREAFRAGLRAHGVRQRAVTGPDKKWVDSAVRHEAGFLAGVGRDMVKGKSVKSLAPRIAMYGAAALGAFHAGRVASAGPNQQIHWIVDRAAENCQDCLELEARGPYTRDTLPTTPRAGATKCRSNCKCELVFDDVSDEQADQIVAQAVTPNYLLRRLTGPRAKRR